MLSLNGRMNSIRLPARSEITTDMKSGIASGSACV